jgi:hypothetical protein
MTVFCEIDDNLRVPQQEFLHQMDNYLQVTEDPKSWDYVSEARVVTFSRTAFCCEPRL